MSKYHITEDMMGKRSYTEYTRKEDDISVYLPLFFSCLKRYRLVIEDTTLTQNYNTVKDGLTYVNAAYNALMIQLKTIIYDSIVDNIKLLNVCLYSDPSILFEGYVRNAYINFNIDTIKELYEKAYKLLIDNAKASTSITEKDIGYRILGYKLMSFDSDYMSLNTRNRIMLFLMLVQEYNEKRGNKITPTGKQYFTYLDQKTLNLALPDTFNTLFFDANYYAFAEFQQLRNNIIKLMLLDFQKVQEKVDEVYQL